VNSQFPPGPQGDILFGNFWQLRRDRLTFMAECAHQYGDIVHLRAGPTTHLYLLNHPNFIREVLIESPEKFAKTPALKNSTAQVLGQGLLTSEGDFHKKQRRLVQPAFHQARVVAYGQISVEHTLRMLDSWQTGQHRELYSEMTQLTLSIVSEALFGTSVSENAVQIGQMIAQGVRLFHERLTSPFNLPAWLPTARNQQFRRVIDYLNRTITEIIQNRRTSGQDTGDLLSMLVLGIDEEGSGQMSIQQVQNEVMTLFIAGHETTAILLNWAWYLLAKHPLVEAKLVEEITMVLGGSPPTVYDLGRLPYTDMVIKETLRLYPPSWIMGRQAIEDVKIGGYVIPKGSLVFVSPYLMQRDSRYFEDPEIFNPERFAENLEKRLPRGVYFPFGSGPRLCIGQSFAMMEARLILATIVQRFHCALASDQVISMDPIVTMRPHGGMPMTISAR